MRSKWLLPFLIVIGALLVFYFYRKYKVAPDLDLNSLPLSDLSGKPVQFSSFSGKATIVCFSASWCGPCRKELHEMNKINVSEVTGAKVVVISDEPVEKIAALQQSGNYPFVFVQLQKAFHSIGVNSIPTTYLVGADNEVKKRKVGYIDWSDPSTAEHMKKLME
jgi:thiol-disulfide isomerase/thioredoxin